jgi:hypothetical protein
VSAQDRVSDEARVDDVGPLPDGPDEIWIDALHRDHDFTLRAGETRIDSGQRAS